MALCIWLYPSGGFASTFEVKARQVGASEMSNMATCNSDAKNTCYLTLPIVPAYRLGGDRDFYLDIAMTPENDDFILDFLWRGECLFNYENGNCESGYRLALEKGSAQEILHLAVENPLRADDPKSALVARPALPIVEIEIIITPAP
ncbi:MAG: hypothetical protein KTR28_07275 [Micavibrio sp.]|nr:hypothetical protein [Micavibrio sp.]